MQYKLFVKKKSLYLYSFLLILFSFFFNQYFAFIGVLPVDSFSTFNGGFDVLNGSYPFKDYWTIKGSFLDLLQSVFFRFFGVSWFTYAAHASFFNSLFAISSFLVFKKSGLKNKYCFYYSILASILMYPTYGTPFTDHHASILSMISIYLLILALKNENNIFWFFIPVIIFISFFSKQTPTAYIGILIILAIFFYFIINFKLKILISLLLGSLTIISIFFLIILINEIPIKAIINQQFLYPMYLGNTRLEWLFPLEFKRFVLRFKLHYFSIYFMVHIFIRQTFLEIKFLRSVDSIIIILLIGVLFIFISHQLLTINGMFIFFLIPIFCGFSHIFLNKYMPSKKAKIFIIILSLISTFYYFEKYTYNRETLALKGLDFNNSINGSELDKKFKGLKWITYHYSKNPTEEINNLKDAINIIKLDKRKKMIVTDYQFISVILSINDNSAARIWWRHHLYPDVNEKYFDIWKDFLFKSILNKKIEIIYTIHPLEGEKNIFQGLIDDKCILKNKLTKILDAQIIDKECDEIKNFIKQ